MSSLNATSDHLYLHTLGHTKLIAASSTAKQQALVKDTVGGCCILQSSNTFNINNGNGMDT